MGYYRRKRIWPVVTISAMALVLVLLLAAAWLMSTLSLEIQLNGDEQVTIQYGESYTDLGAVAVLKSSVLGEYTLDLRVEAEKPVSIDGPGDYIIQYKTGFWWLETSNERTVTVQDQEAPVITLISVPGSFTIPGQEYQEEGFVAKDNADGDITDKVQRTVTETEVIYTVTDSSGNVAEVRRTIVYGDVEAPVLSLNEGSEITVNVGTTYADPGYTATDNADGDLTAQVQVEGNVDTYKSGTYTITYTVTDSYGNVATATRTVTVQPVPQPDAVNPGDKVVYLTFDDGPCAYTKTLLDVLAKYNVKATFFVVDKGTNNNKIMQRIVEEGHAIGVHSLTHDYDTIYVNEEAYLQDFNAMRQIIYDQTGVWTTLFRFPGGSSNGVSKSYNEVPGIMTRLTKLMTDMGYQYFDWNVSSGDAGGVKTADGVYSNVVSGIQKHNVSVVLQHDIKKYSVEAVERIIIWGLENGYTFLPLDSTSPVCHHSVNN